MSYQTVRIGLTCACLAAGCVLVGAGCSKDDSVQSYTVKTKEPEPVAPAAPAAAPSAGESIDWGIPSSWTKEPPRQIVFAAFKIDPADPKSECTVTQMPAGMSMLANVVRWEGQLHLPASTEDSLKSVMKDETLPAGPATRVDLTAPAPAAGDDSPQQRIVAVVLPHEDYSWVFKLVGRADILTRQLPVFDEFVKSVRFTAGDAGSGTAQSTSPDSAPPIAPGAMPPTDAVHGGLAGIGPTTDAAAPAVKLTKWATPPGWTQEPAGEPGGMRQLAFKIAAGDKQAEAIVIRLPGFSLDQLPNDVNMWRGEVSLPPADTSKADEGAPIPIVNRLGRLYDFTGPKTDNAQSRLIVALVLVGEDGWFFKLTGPANLVEQQKQTFLDFVKSTEFGQQ